MVEKKHFRQLSPYLYEIPQSFRSDMRVPARIYADQALLSQIMHDQSLEQLVNTATLPGIVKYALAMPDIHQGYGFSIGGVVATDPAQGGVVSPGGVGYDINCLTGDSQVLARAGATPVPSPRWRGDWQRGCAALPGFRRSVAGDATGVAAYLRQTPQQPLLRLVTDGGDEIIATADHPFWTPGRHGRVGALRPGDAGGALSLPGCALPGGLTAGCWWTKPAFDTC